MRGEQYIGVPASLRKDAARCPAEILLYEDSVWAGAPLRRRWSFREFPQHAFVKATPLSPVARIRFYRCERPAPGQPLQEVSDPVELCFSGGPFRCREANAFAESFLHDLIQAKMRLLSPGY